jgi:type IV secretion system protein VirB6
MLYERIKAKCDFSRNVCFFLLMFAAVLFFPCLSYADPGYLEQILTKLGVGNAVLAIFHYPCTWNLHFWMPNVVLPMVQTVIIVADLLVTNAMEDLFKGILEFDGHGNFSAPVLISVISMACTLFVIFYGIAFIFAISPLTGFEVLARITKMAIVLSLLSPDAWDFYQLYFVGIFYDGIQDLIDKVIDIGDSAITIGGVVSGNLTTGGIAIAIVDGAAKPLAMFANITTMVFSERMMIIMFTCFGSGPYGVPMGLALGYGIWQVLSLLFRVVEVYGLSLIVRAILLGIGPIFFVFYLFNRTQSLFVGWLNQLMSFSLQPLLMFSFLSFFVPMLESSINAAVPRGIVEACYVPDDAVKSVEHSKEAWRFAFLGYPYQGSMTKDGVLFPIISKLAGWISNFPIHPMALFIFIIVAYTARQLVDVASALGNDLARGMLVLGR